MRFLVLIILVFPFLGNAQSNLTFARGLYLNDQGESLIINAREGFPHLVLLSSGETHMLRNRSASVFEVAHNRNNWSSTDGVLTFDRSKSPLRLCWKRGASSNCWKRVALRETSFQFEWADSLTLGGWVVLPEGEKTRKLAVLLHGDGPNDRYDLYDVGMYLLSRGIGFVAFDKRNVGTSSGSEITESSYTGISREYAEDATKLVQRIQRKYPNYVVGVVGISQGGWIGGMVASQVQDLGFYANIAGNMSIGWHQWQHYMLSYLKRNGFSEEEVEEAKTYFHQFFEAGLGSIDFATYTKALEKVEGKPWLERLDQRKLVRWRSETSAREVVQRNANDPLEELKGISAPTLGIFHEFDHSTPPDSPVRFLDNMSRMPSADVTVRIFPKTTHGGWVVPSYYFHSMDITRMESDIYFFLANWINDL